MMMALSPGLKIMSESSSRETSAELKSSPAEDATLQGTICIQCPRWSTIPSLSGDPQYFTRETLPDTDLVILTDGSVVTT